MAVRPLGVDDIELFRELRLAALAGDPDAFSSDFAREAAFDDDDWARRIRDFRGRPGVVLVDRVDAEAVGMTGVAVPDDEALLWGMWVRPAARGTGVASRLIDAAVAWAASTGASTLGLWVMRTNHGAIAGYRRAGFEFVDDGAPPPPPGCHDEQFMRRPV